MPEGADEKGAERAGAAARAVKTGAVAVHQAGAESISAEEVTIRQGGALRVQADEVKITQGGIALASAEKIRVTAGRVGAFVADRARLEQTAISIAAARESAALDQSAAGVVLARAVTVRDSIIGLAVTPRLEATNVRVLMGPRAALAFGAGVGVVLALARLWRRR
jgi:hypothetical protein